MRVNFFYFSNNSQNEMELSDLYTVLSARGNHVRFASHTVNERILDGHDTRKQGNERSRLETATAGGERSSRDGRSPSRTFKATDGDSSAGGT
jgi:hypothetical protein